MESGPPSPDSAFDDNRRKRERETSAGPVEEDPESTSEKEGIASIPSKKKKQEDSLKTKATVKTIRKNLKDMRTTDADHSHSPTSSPNEDNVEVSSSVPVLIRNDKKRGIAPSSSGVRMASEGHEIREGDRVDEEYDTSMSPRKRITRRNTLDIGIRSGDFGSAAASAAATAAAAAAGGSESDKSVEDDEGDQDDGGDKYIEEEDEDEGQQTDGAEPMAMTPKGLELDGPLENEEPISKDVVKGSSFLSSTQKGSTDMAEDSNEAVNDVNLNLEREMNNTTETAAIPAAKPAIGLFGGGKVVGAATAGWEEVIEDDEYEGDKRRKAALSQASKVKANAGVADDSAQSEKSPNKKYVFEASAGLNAGPSPGSGSVPSVTGLTAGSVWGSTSGTGFLSRWRGSSNTPTIGNSIANNTGAMDFTADGGGGFGSFNNSVSAVSSNASLGAASQAKTGFGFSVFSSSTTSPFGTFGAANNVASTTSPSTTTMPSTSSFASLASSAASPFASVTASSPSPFASVTVNSPSPFASTIAKSSTPQSTSNISSPFATAAQAGTISSFGSLLAKSRKESKEEDDQEVEEDEDEPEEGWEESSGSTPAMFLEGSKVKVPGVHETEVKTGEEEESMIFQVKAKLYVMDGQKQWKERGIGNLRLNMRRSDRRAVRLVMRADGVFRVILNAPLFAGMSCELAQEKFVRIIAVENGQLQHFAIKVANKNIAEELYEVLRMSIPPKPNNGEDAHEVDDAYEEEADYEERRLSAKWA
ncbi:hypothetical protein BC937DRAFT_91351 [Endogone sp. FLAS-F59071]|nr:hypothetical protein BC937DRAFT_91351 [Endogone sp. FLAS-F59071]|eukprot:RUS16322.1 hypothetical protein BC937DRAFT_91351 [Endogone sp. FLAS-F59071]